MGVVVAAVSGAAGRGRRPTGWLAGVAGEVGDGVAELFVAGPAEADGTDFAGLAGRGCGAGEAGQGLGGGELGAAVADLGEQPGGADPAGRGRLVKMWASACAASWRSIWLERVLICSTRVTRRSSRAWVMWAWVAASAPVMPCGAAIRRRCSAAGIHPAGVALLGQPVGQGASG